MAYQRTIRYFIAAGATWALAASGLGLLNELQLLLATPRSDFSGFYALVRPAYTTALLFGAGGSLFLGGAYYCIEKAEGGLKHEALGLAAFGLLQAAVLFGVLTILGGANKGREYGEMSILSDNLLALALVIFLVSVMWGRTAPRPGGYSVTYIGTIVAASGLLAVFLAGNVGQPHGPLMSAPLFSGLQDAHVQEFYRSGLLAFLVVSGALALAYHFVPEYYGVPLYSRSMAGFQIFGTLVALPFAGGAVLAHSAAPAVGQTIGAVAVVSGAAAILSGALSLIYTVTRSEQPVRSDRFALFVRYGLALLVLWTVVRAVLGLRFTQASFAFTSLNSQDIARDIQTYGLLIFFGVGYLALQRASDRPVLKGLVGWHLGLSVAAALSFLAGDLLVGIPQALATHAVADGKLTTLPWQNILFAGALTGGQEKVDLVSLYVSSGRALHLVGAILACGGGLFGALAMIPAAFGAGSGYQAPTLRRAA